MFDARQPAGVLLSRFVVFESHFVLETLKKE